jgi:hypothetical protein
MLSNKESNNNNNQQTMDIRLFSLKVKIMLAIVTMSSLIGMILGSYTVASLLLCSAPGVLVRDRTTGVFSCSSLYGAALAASSVETNSVQTNYVSFNQYGSATCDGKTIKYDSSVVGVATCEDSQWKKIVGKDKDDVATVSGVLFNVEKAPPCLDGTLKRISGADAGLAICKTGIWYNVVMSNPSTTLAALNGIVMASTYHDCSVTGKLFMYDGNLAYCASTGLKFVVLQDTTNYEIADTVGINVLKLNDHYLGTCGFSDKGKIAFSNANFYVCKGTGAWTTLI